ncbi:transcription factor IIA, alpha/beta subunit-domain-containing protein [Mycena olivaceomarginata]|nr:transcription factor IIA, alpha/beta subunit-domain-containing protein [Mycena olivaceomarginata]
MSNKVVPSIYRAVIDDVVASIRPAFDEFGVDDDVLNELQSVKTEHPTPANGGMGLGSGTGVRYSQYAHGQQGLPPLPSPALSALGLSFPSASASSPPNGARAHSSSPFTHPGSTPTPTPMSFPASTAGLYRLPQTDGPAPSYDDEDEDEDDLEPVQRQLPRTAHPSLSVPKAAAHATGANGAGARGGNGGGEEDDEAINSDLDDSDDEDDDAADEEGAPEGAIVFCTYDKVARVKNKWKCVLKDGMIHTGGRDYLFQRCTGFALYHSRIEFDALDPVGVAPGFQVTGVLRYFRSLVVLNLPRRTKNITDLTITPGTHSRRALLLRVGLHGI